MKRQGLLILSAVIFSLFLVVSSMGSAPAWATAGSATVTSITVTSGARSSLKERPTGTANAPAPMLTMTAFSAQIMGTVENRPTATAGPSEIVLNGKPHLIDFWAAWCAPCALMKPAMRKMEAKYGDTVTFWKIDIDNPGSDALTIKYRVEFIPYIVLLDKNGKKLSVLEGYQTETQLERAIQNLLKATGS